MITICNLDYVTNHSLLTICARLSENGVKFIEIILSNSKEKFVNYRQFLIKRYINVKISTILSVLETIDYSNLPMEEGFFFKFNKKFCLLDVSDFIKELITCVVLIQAELYLIFQPLTKQASFLIINLFFFRYLK